ncbi:MAG: SGNH/GDSL hydrolase family protein [Candidatus Aminicenantes bacterium]
MKDKTKTTIPFKKRIIFILFNLFLMLIILFIGGEIYVRSKGSKPFTKAKLDIQVEPGGKYFQKDTELGYTHLPGKFKITLKKKFTFTTTHRKDTLRITHPVEQDTDFAHKEKIWILGCSITHGWCLNDNETYPWLLQEKIPQYEIINFGVSGYGTIHSLIQLKKALKTMPKPKLVILTYASCHDTRNTFSPVRRRIVSTWNFLGPLSQPYAFLDKQGKLQLHRADKVVYSPWPLARVSALINYLEIKHIVWESGKIPHFQISKALLKRICKICKKEGITMIVAGIKENQKKMRRMLKFCERRKIPHVDISVDLSKKEHNYLPIDAHPSALANRKFAKKLFLFLKENNFLGSSPPTLTLSANPQSPGKK